MPAVLNETTIKTEEESKDDLPDETFDEKPTLLDISTFQGSFAFDEDSLSADLESDVKNGDKVLRMFWLETFEDVYKNPGSVYLFGKVGGKSCCVLVKNIEHKVYFLPRNSVSSFEFPN
jgi:hypothetical protein